MTTVKVWIKKPGQKDDDAVGVDIPADSIVQTLKEVYLGTKEPSRIAVLVLKCGGTELSNRRTYQSYLDEFPTLANATLVAEDGDKTDILRRLEESNAQCIRLQTILDAHKEDLKDILLQIDNALSQHGYYGYEVLALSDSMVVVKAERIADCYTVAIKLHRELSLASHEVDILAEVGGRSHCIKLLDSFAMQECDFSMALVFPYLQSGFWPNCELERKVYMHQILQAIQFCHSRGIIHRDVKPQNIFYSIDQHGHLQFVLGDFDLSHKIGQYELGGTLEYTAPEILFQHNYGFAVDMWAIGIIFAQLVVVECPQTV
jgi:serine/threonine protein kinase